MANFEREFAKYVGAPYAVMVNSGYDDGLRLCRCFLLLHLCMDDIDVNRCHLLQVICESFGNGCARVSSSIAAPEKGRRSAFVSFLSAVSYCYPSRRLSDSLKLNYASLSSSCLSCFSFLFFFLHI